MAADISKGAPKVPANEVCSGRECVNEQLVVKEQSFFQSIIAGYAHDPWFMNLNNVSQLILNDGLWWHHDAIVVPNVVVGESNLGSLREGGFSYVSGERRVENGNFG
jgi:hypothetical protein